MVFYIVNIVILVPKSLNHRSIRRKGSCMPSYMEEKILGVNGGCISAVVPNSAGLR